MTTEFMGFMIKESIWSCLVLLISIAVHEFGHKAVIDNTGDLNSKMKWSVQNSLYLELPVHFTRNQKIKVILAGIIGGLIVLVLFYRTLNPFAFAMIFTLYLVIGCRHDIKLLGDLMAGKKEKWQ
jgi:hypothetical protein